MRVKYLFACIPLITLLIFISFYELPLVKEEAKENVKLIEDDVYHSSEELPDGDTFSIVAVDTATGEVGGAGTSCVGFSIDFLSDLILDNNGNILGGIHAQAAAEPQNATNARNRMLAGDSPDEIITWLRNNDCCNGGAAARQYGIVDFGGSNGTPRVAGFTGNTNSNYAGHIEGVNYAIQGNIVLNADVLADMETAFLNANGSLADKLMAALKGAKRVGGDNRCSNTGNSGRASFIKVLRPGDTNPYINISLGPVANGVEPIDELECALDAATSPEICLNRISTFPYEMDFEDFVWKKENESCGSENTNASWIRSQFGTPSNNTGPNGANQGGLYMFVESSDLTNNNIDDFSRRAVIGSPCFDIPANHTAEIAFDYHMSGATMGVLSLTAQTNSGTTTIWSRSGDQGTNWINDEVVDLSNYSGIAMKLRFDATTGDSFTSDMAIDDINITIRRFPIAFIFDNGSWTPNAPSLISNLADAEDSIEILSGSPTLAGDVTIGDVTLASGATFTSGNNTLNVSGDIDNQGSFNTASGILNFNGTEAQSISGNTISVETLQLNNLGTLSLNTGVLVSGVMDLNSGILQTNNNLTFTDTYNTTTGFHTTGLLNTVNGGTINGDVNVERYIPGNRAFRLISSSVTTTGTIRENWQENGVNTAGFGTHITGNGGATNGFDPTTTNNSSLFQLNTSGQTYQAVANTNVKTIDAGEPYLMLFRGDRTVDLSSNSPLATPTLLRTKGALLIGNYNVPEMSAVVNGSSLIGNPYQAPVDMSQVLANTSNVNTRYYHIYDQNIGDRGAFVTVDTQDNTNSLTFGGGATLSQANKFLQPHQAAFVNTIASGPASLEFLEAHKDVSGSGTGVFLTNPPSESHIGIALFSAEGNELLDGAKVIFSNEDTYNYNEQDALKVSNLDESISTVSDNQKLSIQRRNVPTEDDIIELSLSNTEANSYTFKVVLSDLGSNVQAYLKDAYLDTLTQLGDNSETEMSFTIDDIAESSADNRFQIVFTEEVLSASDLRLSNSLSILPNPANDFTNIQIANTEAINQVSIFDIRGREVFKAQLNRRESNLRIDTKALPSGLYIVKVVSENDEVSSSKLVIKR